MNFQKLMVSLSILTLFDLIITLKNFWLTNLYQNIKYLTYYIPRTFLTSNLDPGHYLSFRMSVSCILEERKKIVHIYPLQITDGNVLGTLFVDTKHWTNQLCLTLYSMPCTVLTSV